MIESFTIGGVEWEVKIDNDRLEDLNLLGLCEYPNATISLLKKENMSKDVVKQTLYHEVCHAILDTMGEKELSNNEKFVETFSTLLHQFEKSKVDTESVITKYLEEEATKDYIKTHPIEANQISVLNTTSESLDTTYKDDVPYSYTNSYHIKSNINPNKK